MSSGHQGYNSFLNILPCGTRGNINYGDEMAVRSSTYITDLLREKEDLDKHLASSMKVLSVEDRKLALEEIHGAAPADQEEPIVVNQRLGEIESHLTKLKTKGSAYDLACNESLDYVSNRNLSLMFLRSNRYDSKLAAEQIIKFFELKKFLFGAEKLTRDIVFQDLSAEDKKSLEEGSCQVLSNKDSINRTILLFVPGLRSPVSVESEARARFYLLMKTLKKSDDTQRRGIVAIIYAVAEYQDREKKGVGASLFARLATCLPVPWAGIHLCCDDFKEYVILRAFVTLLPAFVKAKFRVNLGTHMEVQYALRGFGIPAGSIPISPTNSAPLLQNHSTWCLQSAFEDNRDHPTVQKNQLNTRPSTPSKRLAEVSSAESMAGTTGEGLSHESQVNPQAGDALLGHGFRLNPGNLKLHDMIREIVDHYDAAERKGDKMIISRKVVEAFKASGSRFLSFDGNTRSWSIVNDKVARNKVAKAIRNRRRSVEAGNNNKATLSRHGTP
ncbi:unnamed protein product [Cylindrotheca closterium]|uniref:DUF6824 domain-containing protein n=1 Tax=Cylindrotheca closterium TaxID=2856 RepID=A0AAD2JJZ7_9STRA|nr:unnamed protein product [Cylindrotheca closterium]